MRIADVLRNKGAAVVTINPDATVGELLAGLAEQNIGAMVVVGAEGVVGIVSERDVVRQLHTYGASVRCLARSPRLCRPPSPPVQNPTRSTRSVC